MSRTSYDSSSTEEEEEEEEVRRPPPIAPPPPLKLSKPSAAAPKPKSPIPSSSEDEDDDEGEKSSGGGGGGDDSSSDTDENPPSPKSAAPTPTQPSDSDSTDDDSASSVPVPPIDSSASKPLKSPPVWSVEDETALLRGMVEYRAKSGRVPSLIDLDALHEFIKGSLSIDVPKPHLWNKVCDLKKKYETVARRGEERGGPYFKKAHNRAAFELSRQIWPLNVGSSENGAGDEHGEDDEPAEHKKMDELAGAIKKMKYSDRLLGQAAEYAASGKRPACIEMEAGEIVDPSKAAMVKEKYKKLILSEIKHDLERMELLKETAKLFMDAIKKMD